MKANVHSPLLFGQNIQVHAFSFDVSRLMKLIFEIGRGQTYNKNYESLEEKENRRAKSKERESMDKNSQSWRYHPIC